jgi:Zn-dependent protease
MGGSFRLFKFSGIQVYLHFSWFLYAAYQFTQRQGVYASPIWAAWEYLAVFAIVLLHEFGHALACRQTGGTANQIVLWPLGGIALASPPRRPGAMLWTIAAGPLVNVVLIPVLLIVHLLVIKDVDLILSSDLVQFVQFLWSMNIVVLIFNMLPVYPLDGGQILRSLLWFPLGEIRSLQIASVIGLIGAVILAAIAWFRQIMEPFLIVFMGLFLISQAIAGWQYARVLVQEEAAKRQARLTPTVPESERPAL